MMVERRGFYFCKKDRRNTFFDNGNGIRISRP